MNKLMLLCALSLVLASCCKVVVIDGNQLHDTIVDAKDGRTIVLKTGTYDYYPEDGTTMWLDPSGCQSGEKHVLFPIIDKKDITIDGSGSKLIIHGDAFPFAIRNSSNIILKNFEIESKFPSTLGLKITATDETGFSAKIVGDACPFVISPDGNVEFQLEGRSVRSQDGRISAHSLDRIAIQYIMTPDAVGDKDTFPASFVGIRWTNPEKDSLRFEYYGDTHRLSQKTMYEVGENVVINLEEKRYRGSIFMEDSDDVTIKDVRIVRMGGMGLVAQMCGNVTLDGYQVWPDSPGSVTTTADMMYIVSCYGDLTVRNCKVGYSLDDAINVHGLYHKILSYDSGWLTLKAMHGSHAGFFPYRNGDMIEILDAHSREVFANAKVDELVRDGQDPYTFKLHISDLDGDEVMEGLLVENTTRHPSILIEDNYFENYPNCRLSGRGGIVFRKNTMKNACTAVYAYDLADYWYESGRISSLVIEDNDLIDCNAMGGNAFIQVGVSGWDGEMTPKIHDRVVIKGNRVSGVIGDFARVYGVKEYVE